MQNTNTPRAASLLLLSLLSLEVVVCAVCDSATDEDDGVETDAETGGGGRRRRVCAGGWLGFRAGVTGLFWCQYCIGAHVIVWGYEPRVERGGGDVECGEIVY